MINDFYVYLHRRYSDNLPFYVGKGKGNRAYSTKSRNPHWNYTYKKHGLIVEILYDNLTENEAFDLEVDIIAEMKYHFQSTMCNMTNGGEGTSGHVQSKDTIDKRVAKNTGKKRTPEQRKKISDALKGKCSDKLLESIRRNGEKRRGKPRDPEAVLKTAISNTGKTRTEKTKELQRKRAKERGVTDEFLQQTLLRSMDKKLYRFWNENGEIFIGTRVEFCKTYNINRQCVQNCVSRGMRGVFQGWRMELHCD